MLLYLAWFAVCTSTPEQSQPPEVGEDNARYQSMCTADHTVVCRTIYVATPRPQSQLSLAVPVRATVAIEYYDIQSNVSYGTAEAFTSRFLHISAIQSSKVPPLCFVLIHVAHASWLATPSNTLSDFLPTIY